MTESGVGEVRMTACFRFGDEGIDCYRKVNVTANFFLVFWGSDGLNFNKFVLISFLLSKAFHLMYWENF